MDLPIPSSSVTVRLVQLCMGSLALWLALSFCGVPALPWVSLIFYLLLLILAYSAFSKELGFYRSRGVLIGIIIFVFFGVVSLAWLKDLYVAPSNDDTINHLGFLKAIVESKVCLLGKIDKPWPQWFGHSHYQFYPAGSHAITAILYYPFSFFDISITSFYRFLLMITLSSWPALLWWSSRRAFPGIPLMLHFFLVMAASTQPSFPLYALGEGGISRIFAMTFFVPLWFQAISGKAQPWIWTCIAAPLLLYLHPSLLPLIGVPLFFFSRRNFFISLAGSVPGALVFYFIARTGDQLVFAFNDLPAFMGWFDRLKGPIHYWFTDPFGFGKFLSPKNWVVYLALIQSLFFRANLRILLIFCIPFVFASLIAIPHPLAQQLGLIYYHSIRRIAELTPLLGLTIACLALERKHLKIPPIANFALGTLSAIFFFLYFEKSMSGLNTYHLLFDTPTKSRVESIAQDLSAVSPNAVVVIDDHHFDALRFKLSQRVVTLLPECPHESASSPYCANRRNFAHAIEQGEIPPDLIGTEIWWIPSSGQVPKAPLKAIPINKDKWIYQII